MKTQLRRTADNEINFWIEVIKTQKKKKEEKEAKETYKQVDMVIDFAYSIGIYSWKEANELKEKIEDIIKCPFDL